MAQYYLASVSCIFYSYRRQTLSGLYTIMCFSIGTLKKYFFPFVPNGKFIIFRCPKIWAHYSLIMVCLNIGTPNNHQFPSFGTNGKVMVLGVPILEHFRVSSYFFFIRQESFELNPIGNPVYNSYKVSHTPSVAFLKAEFSSQASNFTGNLKVERLPL